MSDSFEGESHFPDASHAMHPNHPLASICRLHYVKKIISQKKRDVELLKVRLDVYSDEWRTAQPDPLAKVKAPTNLTPTGKIRKPRKKNAINAAVKIEGEAADADVKPPSVDGKYKRKRSKSDKVS